MQNPTRIGIWIAGLIFGLLYAGVAWSSPPTPPEVRLKVALLPIPDSMPFYVARERGYFKAAGIDVYPLPVNSPVDRDQLMQAGEIDGMLTEIATTATFNRDRMRIKIVTTARIPLAPHSLFRILAAPGSDLDSVSDLAGVAVAVSRNTVIEYVTERLLTVGGLDRNRIVTRSVPVIPERYQLLMQGQVRAATLPEPLASSALAAGASQIVADADFPQFSVSVVSFRVASIRLQPDAIRKFVKAWDLAAADINSAPENFRGLMLRHIRVPANVRNTFPIPTVSRAGVPDVKQWADAMDWMISRGLLQRPVPYTDSVTKAFLPR